MPMQAKYAKISILISKVKTRIQKWRKIKKTVQRRRRRCDTTALPNLLFIWSFSFIIIPKTLLISLYYMSLQHVFSHHLYLYDLLLKWYLFFLFLFLYLRRKWYLNFLPDYFTFTYDTLRKLQKLIMWYIELEFLSLWHVFQIYWIHHSDVLKR